MTSPKPTAWFKTKQISVSDIGQLGTTGRTPWYSASNKSRRHKQTFLIGIAGGTASGKTSVCRAIVNRLQMPWVQILSLDCFYKPLSKEQRANVHDYNFDHPNAFDWQLLLTILKELKSGKAVRCPQYDFTTHARKEECSIMYGADVVLCEGILMLHHPEIVKQFDLKVFVKTDDDIRLIRRIRRDMAQRGRSLESVLDQYERTVKPSYSLFCEPTQAVADIVIPRGKANLVAISLLSDHIANRLIEVGNVTQKFFARDSSLSQTESYMSLNVLLPSDSNKSVVFNALNHLQNTQFGDAMFLQRINILCEVLLHICVEKFIPLPFETPSPPPMSPQAKAAQQQQQNQTNDELIEMDEKVQKQQVCIVTVFSGGMVFGETVLKVLQKNPSFQLNYGSLHIFHESHKPSKPRFYDRKLPINIQEQKVILVDAFVNTGNRARMALQVIIEHHVPEKNICYVALQASNAGIVNLAKVFPNVTFITGRIEKMDNDQQNEMITTSSLVMKYCKAAKIDIIDYKDNNDSST